jgi:hypothetical protein
MKALHKGEPTDAQLRWLKAINDYWVTSNGFHAGVDDLLVLLSLRPYSTNAGKEMLERLERDGYVDWPLNKPRVRSQAKSDRLCRRANSIRLTPKGLALLKEET